MQQILKETKIKYIHFVDNPPFPTYEKTNSKELLAQENLIITNPTSFTSTIHILDSNNKEFIRIADNVNFLELISDKLFYIKINGGFRYRTKHFSYLNEQEQLGTIDILNGGCLINSITNLIIFGPIMEDIKVDCVICRGIN